MATWAKLATGRPVLQDFMQRLPATLELTLASLILAIGFGVPLGVVSALHREKLIDHFGRVVAVAGVALPSFWTALLLIYVFFYLLGVAPAPLGRLGPDGRAAHAYHRAIRRRFAVDRELVCARLQPGTVALPSFTLAISIMAPLARMVRATMLETLVSDYVKAAWAAGLPRGWSSMATRCAMR